MNTIITEENTTIRKKKKKLKKKKNLVGLVEIYTQSEELPLEWYLVE